MPAVIDGEAVVRRFGGITPHQDHIRKLATAAIQLHEGGLHALHPSDIARQRWDEVVKFQLKEVLKRLPEIRRELHTMGFSVLPVSESYFSVRRQVDFTGTDVAAEAVRREKYGQCLPIGYRSKQAGILFVTDEDQLSKALKYWYERWVYVSSRGRETAAVERVKVSLELGTITKTEALDFGITTALEAPNPEQLQEAWDALDED